MVAKSIRWRLQLWVAFLLACVLSGFGLTVYQLQRNHLLNQIDEDLGRRVSTASSAVRKGASPPPFEPGRKGPPLDFTPGGPGFNDAPGPPPPGRIDPGASNAGPNRVFGPRPRLLDKPFPRPPSQEGPFGPRDRKISTEATNLFASAGTNSFYLAFWWSDDTLVLHSTNAPANLQCPERLPADTRVHARIRDGCREAYHFTEMGDCVLAGCSLAAFASSLHRFTGLLLAAGSVVLAFGLGGGWWLTGRAIRPIANISATAGRISAGNLAERIDVAEADTELGQLASVLNSTFARLEAAFAQQRQFTADASHELRTPLAVIITEAQTALARERDASEYRQTLEDCLSTAQQMRRLVESLLELARFDAGQESMKRELFDLSQVARECVGLVRPLAERRRIRIDCNLPTIRCPGDAARISQVVTNLLTNAIGFNHEEGAVLIELEAQDSVVLLKVQDTGPGIPTQDLPHIFERFYRVDKARSSVQGRTGLGLAICKAIVDAHGGSIEVSSQPGGGSAFLIKLPLE
jgi:two-component system, OmpR family, sensor kinase